VTHNKGEKKKKGKEESLEIRYSTF
jgi:hypothetical protein